MSAPLRRFLILSDIHSNQSALEAVLADAEQHGPYDQKLCAGDVVGYGPNPNEVIERIANDGFITVLGNHDRAVRGGEMSNFNYPAQAAAQHNRNALTPSSLNFLSALSNEPYLDSESRYAMVHGSFTGVARGIPGKDQFEDVYVSKDFEIIWALKTLRFPHKGDLQIPLGMMGHTHHPLFAHAWVDYHHHQVDIVDLAGVYEFAHEPGTGDFTVDLSARPAGVPENCVPKILFNPGSVGQPRDHDPRAAYGIVEMEGGVVTLRFKRVAYDVAKTQQQMRDASQQHFGDWLIDRLAVGV